MSLVGSANVVRAPYQRAASPATFAVVQDLSGQRQIENPMTSDKASAELRPPIMIFLRRLDSAAADSTATCCLIRLFNPVGTATLRTAAPITASQAWTLARRSARIGSAATAAASSGEASASL